LPAYEINRTYDLAGNVTSQTYPSGHTVTYSYDSAGRTSSFGGNLGDGVTRSYASSFIYNARNQITQELFGTQTPLYHKLFYNIRGQLFDMRLSSVNDLWDWNRGRLILYYSSNHIWGQSGTDNNGNVRFAETWIPPENATLDQADTLIEDVYSYDSLNRLSSVQEQQTSVAGGWGNWQQQFRQQYTYDRYGNRTIDAAQTWGAGINTKQFTVNTTTNRLGVPAGQSGAMTYDAAGNLTTDSYSGYGSMTFDANNRIVAAQDSFASWSYYTYNADGQRIKRKINNQETWQIFGIDGELLAEYPANGATASPQKEYGYRDGQLLITAEPAANIKWLVPDHLGTPRIILDKTGSLANVKRHDYLPFGEELPAGTGGRTAAMGYVAGDGVRQQFTQKERDNETGLDYFLARYYSSTQGRFTSPDEFTGGPDELFYFADDASENPTFYADLSKPQSLNKYQYSYSNPLRWVDPDGHDPEESEPPQEPKPVVPLPTIPGVPPLVVPVGPTTGSTPKGPTDAEIIEGGKAVLDTVADYTGITWIADKIRPYCPFCPQPKPAPAQPTPATQPSPTTAAPPQTITQPQARPEPVQSRGRGRGRSRGRGNQKDTGLRDKSDADVAKGARDRSLPKAERQRYKKEEKARGERNRKKREDK